MAVTGPSTFPSAVPVGAIMPNATGSNLWHDGGLLWSKVVNLCGLWVSSPNELFSWVPMHQGFGRALVAQFLIATRERFGMQEQLPEAVLDLADAYRAGANELVFDPRDNAFSLYGGKLGNNFVDVYPSLTIEDGMELDEGISLIGDWVIFGAVDELDTWPTASNFSKDDGMLLSALKRLAQRGFIEVSGRFPDAVSDRVVLEPDVFLSDIRAMPGQCKLVVGETIVWGVKIRLAPNLAIAGMLQDSGDVDGVRAFPTKQISDATLANWLVSFKDQYGRKAKREEATASLRAEYTSTSIREAFARQKDPNLKRSIGEKV